MKRHFIIASVVALLIFSIYPNTVMAQGTGNVVIQPFWVNASSVDVELSFTGTTATCGAYVNGLSGTTKINAKVTLERKNANGMYSTVTTWNPSSDTTKLNFTGSCNVSKGYTYRLTITATVTRNGETETVSNWTEKSL